MTPQESKLWFYLRMRQVDGLRFRTQVGVGHAIVDFFCFACMLAIELDGHQHETTEGIGNDGVRNQKMAEIGVTVLRFTNDRVDHDVHGVVEEIRDMALKLPRRRRRSHR